MFTKRTDQLAKFLDVDQNQDLQDGDHTCVDLYFYRQSPEPFLHHYLFVLSLCLFVLGRMIDVVVHLLYRLLSLSLMVAL